MSTHPLRTRGFTIVELLVVIFIIATLMGLLIPAVTIAKNRAKKVKAVSQLSQIEAGLKVYKDVNGLYPEVDFTGDPGVAMTVSGAGNAPGLLFALKSVDRENFRDAELRDPYKNLVRYRPAKVLPYDATKPKGTIDSDDPPGADSYQLWSAGPNGRDDVTTASDPKNIGDDIVTWK
jgi:prepilin-type N-terminal cleavage/methylation domain-containing protein